jgi:hypothetical protein
MYSVDIRDAWRPTESHTNKPRQQKKLDKIGLE